MAEVNGGNLEFLALDVFPDIHLGPVGEGEDAHVLAGIEPAVVEVPDLGALVLGIPLAEAVAEAEESFLGPRLLLVASCTSDAAVEAELLDGSQKDGDLELVAADLAGSLDGGSFLKGLVDRANDELGVEFLGAPVAELDEFGKLVAGRHIEERHRNVRGTEGLLREAEQADRVLAAGEEDGGTLELRGDLTHDVDRFRFEVIQMIEMIGFHKIGNRCWVMGYRDLAEGNCFL